MQIALTAVVRKVPTRHAAFVDELPGATPQGETLEEARANLAGGGACGATLFDSRAA